MKVEDIIKEVKKHIKNPDIDLIKKAYKYAEKHHRGQKRISGESYLSHLYQVAKLLARYRLDEETIAAGLLHDIIEDTGVTLDDLRRDFGNVIAEMVEAETKVDFKGLKLTADAETLRKMLMASTKDYRVIFLKIMDLLHNMRTADVLKKESQKRLAFLSREVYAPLATRFGLMKVKAELEDLSMKYLEPEIYKELTQKLPATVEKREKITKRFVKELKKSLKETSIKDAEIKGRAKHLYSIYRKMLDRGKSFEEIYDFIAYRIIVKDVKECYAILGIIHNRWAPLPNRFKDFIAMPKANMYQSLHTTILGDNGNPVEIQIRTKEMDEIAEEGIAAHFKYKKQATNELFDKRLTWLKQIMDWQKENKDSMKFIQELKVEFFGDEIFCFTPLGKVIELPTGATALDFAYAVHTHIGDHSQGAKVNNKFVPLRYELHHGDIVEILTSKNAKPGRGWLKIAHTSKALNKIKKSLTNERSIPFRKLIKKNNSTTKLQTHLITIKGIKDPKYSLAKCCNPLPGDSIIGYETKTGLIKVHKLNCKKIPGLEKGNWNKKNADWKKIINTTINLIAEGKDRVGLGADLLNTVAATGTNIKKVSLKMNNDIAKCMIDIEIDDLNHIKDIIKRILKIQSIDRVRIGGEES